MKITLKALLISTLLALFLSFAAFAAADTIFFGFDDGKLPSNLKPPSYSNYTIENGILSARDVTTTDTYFTFNGSINADDYASVSVRIKHDLIERENKAAPICQVFYTGTDASGAAISLAESNSLKTNLVGLSSDGEYVIYTLPLDKSNLAGAVIKSLRFDIVNCAGSYDLDYIMLTAKNPNADLVYEFNTDGDAEGWGYANLASAYTISGGTLSGTNAKSNGLIAKTFSSMLFGGDYPKMYVRMKTDGITESERALIYTDLYDEDGNNLKANWWTDYDGYNNISSTHTAANDGSYVLHTFNFSGKSAYMNNYFKYMVLNNVEHESASFAVDYIILKNKNSFEWTFDHTDFADGWTTPSGFALSDGDMTYTGGDSYGNPMFFLYSTSIEADNYDGFEIIMKHAFKPDSAASGTTAEASDIRLYYKGTAADGSVISWAEGNTGKAQITSASSGDSYVRYYIDLSSKTTWKGASITDLRIDPINANGDCSIAYMRLVPNDNVGAAPLDESLVTMSYEFEDETAGNADGVITIDIGGQSYSDIKKLTVSWADADGAALADYSTIKAFTAGEFNGTYTIDKNMLIPDAAKKIIAEIKDTDKTFTVSLDLPEGKLPADLGEPLYTVALISDIHVGGWGSETAPNARLTAAREQINELADYVVINGDLTQWYGARSGEEFKIYNYNGSSYRDNGETDTSYLDQNLGVSQWELLREYFEGFDIPVYPVQGNHDIRDGDGWNAVYYRPEYWVDTFHGWLDYSNTATDDTQKFPTAVDYSTEHNYYDAEIGTHHYIFLEMPKIPSPYYSFGDEQLAWLDKKLYEKEATGKPIFVFTHVPTESIVNASYWDTQIGDDEKFQSILAKHPTAIVVSGHTHYSLDIDAYSSYDGAQNEFSVIHDGGTTTINIPNGTNYKDLSEIAGSHGVIAEVYSDRILLRGRDFVADKWLSKGYTLLTFKEAPDFSVAAVRSLDESGSTVLSVENPDSSLSYTWIVDGVETTGEAVTLTADAGYAALRAADESGSYVSELYEDISAIPEKKAETALTVSDGTVQITGLDHEAYLIICSFTAGRFTDIKIQTVSEDCTVTISDTGLQTAGCDRVTAMLLKKASLSPLTESGT